jgi:DNA-binding LytR/AlgR family response regulator
MMDSRPTALIADDEPLLRDELARMLASTWPELRVVGQARNGREAVAFVDAERPDICFLDVQMPGVSGVEAARRIGERAHLVFVTAFDQYALNAFEHGVVDYLIKPVEASRLARTADRLKTRLRAPRPVAVPEALLTRLAEHLDRRDARPALRWLRAMVGQSLQMIPVERIDFLRSDEKYTLIAWRTDEQIASEALIRTPLKDLMAQLDPAQFAQVHRSVLVNLRSISHVVRGENETADIHLRGRSEVLPVSRSYLHFFRQM